MRKEEINNIHEFDVSFTNREVFLFEEEITPIVASKFVKNLKILENKKDPIIIHQFTNGGDTDSGMAMYDAIKCSPCTFIFLCYGIAASMGSIIPQAAHKKGFRITMPNCNWLIHEGYLSVENNKRAVKAYIKSSSVFTDKMYEIYTNVCYGSEFFSSDTKAKVKSYIKRKLSYEEDWWLTPEQSVYYGFSDAIFGSKDYENIEKIKGYL